MKPLFLLQVKLEDSLINVLVNKIGFYNNYKDDTFMIFIQ